MKNSLIGSTVAMVIGGLSVITDLRYWPSVNDDRIFGGIAIILGALAYRSAKQRRLGLKEDTRRGLLVEIALLILVCVPTLLAALRPDGIVHNPWSSVIIPAWSISAYLVARYKRIQPPTSGMGFRNG